MGPTPADATAMVENQAAQLGAAFGRLTTHFTALTAAAGVASHGLDALVGTIRTSISRFVESFDPGKVQLFEQAVTDANAALGRVLAPALEVATHLVRRIGDAFAAFDVPGRGVVEAAKKIIDAFGPVIDEFVHFANEFAGWTASFLENNRGVIEAFAKLVVQLVRLAPILLALNPVLAPFVVAMALLEPILTVLEPLIEALAEGLKYLTDSIMEALQTLGLVSETEGKKKDSTGMGVNRAQFTSAQSYAQSAYASAYGLGSTMSEADKAKVTKLDGINQTLAEIRDWLKNLKLGGALGRGYDDGRGGGGEGKPDVSFKNLLNGSGPAYALGKVAGWIDKQVGV